MTDMSERFPEQKESELILPEETEMTVINIPEETERPVINIPGSVTVDNIPTVMDVEHDYTPTFINWDENQFGYGDISGLIEHTSVCNNRAGIFINYNDVPYDPFGMASSHTIMKALILVVDSVQLATISSDGANLIQEFNSRRIKTLGHCFITWDKTKDICGIWDVCLHRQQGHGLGSLLVDKIIESLAIHVSTTTQLWLGVDLQNKQFGKVANLYAKFGFSNPFISYVDPFGKNHKDSLPLGFVSLQRPNDYIDPTEINRTSIMAEITYMIMEYLRVAYFRLADQRSKDNLTKLESYKLVNKGIETEMPRQSCVLHVYFYPPYAKWLKSLVLSGSTLNTNGSVTQKEFTGSFSLDTPILHKSGRVVWRINKDHTRPIMIGSEQSTQNIPSRYNFHTHPEEVYKKYKVQIGYPSGGDYAVYMQSAIANKTVFHSVIAIEGIYTISLQPFWCQNLNLLKYLFKTVISLDTFINEYMEYDKNKFQNDHGISATTNTDNIILIAQNYCKEWCSRSFIVDNTSYPAMFTCKFLSWEQIENDDDNVPTETLSISYPTSDDQCFATERSLQALHRLHGSQ
jgi:hypothetical protein